MDIQNTHLLYIGYDKNRLILYRNMVEYSINVAPPVTLLSLNGKYSPSINGTFTVFGPIPLSVTSIYIMYDLRIEDNGWLGINALIVMNDGTDNVISRYVSRTFKDNISFNIALDDNHAKYIVFYTYVEKGGKLIDIYLETNNDKIPLGNCSTTCRLYVIGPKKILFIKNNNTSQEDCSICWGRLLMTMYRISNNIRNGIIFLHYDTDPPSQVFLGASLITESLFKL